MSAAELIELGTGFLDTFKYEKAIEYFSRAILLDPHLAEPYEYRGIAFYKILKIPEALQDLGKAVELDPVNHQAWYNKGEIHFYRKEFNLAEAAYLKANEIYGGSFFYLSALAETKLKLKQYQQAADYCDQVLENDPADSIALSFRASALSGLKNYAAAIKDNLKLVDLGKRNATLYNNIGFYYSKLGELRKAENNLLVALQINATHPYALNNLGHVYHLQNNPEEALKKINQSIEIDPSNSYAYKNRALVYIQQGKPVEAQADLKKARALGYADDYDDEVDIFLRTYVRLNG